MKLTIQLPKKISNGVKLFKNVSKIAKKELPFDF